MCRACSIYRNDDDWIYLAQEKDQWQTPMNMVMKLLVP
jgi:hypothetical protein